MNLETFLRILNIPDTLSVDEILDMLIIYLRKSRKDMDYFKDETIEKTLQRHEKDLQDYIIGLFGKPIPEYNIYREVASGDTIENRPVMQKVLSLIEDEGKKGVVCIEIERLARGNTIDQGIIAQTFKYTGTKIITPMKIYDLDNEDDLSYFEDGLYESRKFLKYTKRILARGRVRSVKEGNYVGSILPYGYNKVKIPNEKGFMLVENESEAEVVRLMANLFLNGLNTTYTVKENDTVSTIAKTFGTHKQVVITHNLDKKVGYEINLAVNGKSVKYTIKQGDTLESIASEYNISISNIHIPNDIFKQNEILNIIIEDMRSTNIANYFNYLNITPRVSKEWTANMIRNILQSPSIYGYLTWDRRKTVTTLVNGKIVRRNPNNNDYLIVKGKHYENAILDEDYLRRIKEKFINNRVKTVPNEKELKNPLVGLVECGYCGNHMTRRPYSVRKDAKPTKKRVYDIDKTKLRLLLRTHKGDYSLSEIASSLKVSRYCVCHWFAPNDNKFTIPFAEKWEDLKKLLNIESTEFDQAITTFDVSINPPQADTLMCSRPRCKCVSSKLELVEGKILQTLKAIKDDYKLYVTNYKEAVKKEQNNNKEILRVIDTEIDKINSQIEKACELVEAGAYTKELFKKRMSVLNSQLETLLTQKEELPDTNNLTKEFNNKMKALPILEDVLSKYSSEMTAEEKNELLSTVIKKVIYKKDQGGRSLEENFTLDIILQPFD